MTWGKKDFETGRVCGAGSERVVIRHQQGKKLLL